MKAKLLSTLLNSGALLLLGLSAPVAHAVTIIDSDVHLVGRWDPGSGYNEAGDAQIAANLLVNWVNGTISNPSNATATFYKGVLAPTLPTPLSGASKTDTGGPVAINAGVNPYVLGKYGNVAFLFYLGASGGDFTLPSNIEAVQQGLSHYVKFTVEGGQRVPDSGSTVLLLGIGLSIVALIRRNYT